MNSAAQIIGPSAHVHRTCSEEKKRQRQQQHEHEQQHEHQHPAPISAGVLLTVPIQGLEMLAILVVAENTSVRAHRISCEGLTAFQSALLRANAGAMYAGNAPTRLSRDLFPVEAQPPLRAVTGAITVTPTTALILMPGAAIPRQAGTRSLGSI